MAVALHLAVQQASGTTTPDRRRVRRWVEAALRTAVAAGHPVETAALVVRFVDVDEGRVLNRSFRGKESATNVLTFPYAATEGAIVADIVVCLPVVEDEARIQGKSFVDHCAHLVVHGALHAAGYDHEDVDDAEAMEDLEREALRRFRIADPYADEDGTS